MFSRKLTPLLAVATAAALAGSAQAAVIDTDSVKLTGTGYDFGNGTWVAGSPTGSGDVKFDFSGGRISPRVTGTLHVNDADGTCARMRLKYKDDGGNVLETEYGGEVCVNDDQHHEFSVDLDPYSDAAIDMVEVAVQKETVSGWSTVSSTTEQVNTHDDDVKITEDGVDFGNSSWAVSGPFGSGDMNWNLDDGDVTPRLKGTLYLNNSSGVCARIRLRYLTDGGAFLTSEAGDEKCANDNGRHEYTVNLGPYTSEKIGKVEVKLQTQANNGSWNTAGSETVSIKE